ncbi:tryptophan-rich sensory protein [Candidatus Roizmanbacteria bacterium]|nr:MAG: tryptophan-rich sensory protein [Candidatus Roizmanbacteria bacterium]
MTLDVRKLSISLLAPFASGAIGSIATASSIPTWYAGLEKPVFNPPNWVFGPVWTILYLMMGIAFYLIWNSSKRTIHKRRAVLYYWIQLVLNTLWSLVFFGLRTTLGGIVVIIPLLIFIILTMKNAKSVSYASYLLLIPYLCWVSFATVLTISLFLLN